MKTPTIAKTMIGLLFCAAVALPAASQDQGAGEGAAPDCSRWGFKKLSLGMSVAQVKEQYNAAAPDSQKQEGQHAGQAYRWQHKDGAQSIDFRVLAAGEGDDASVVEVQATIRGGGISPSQWHTALLQKWGGITEIQRDTPSTGQSTIGGRSIDDTCDARVEFTGTGNAEAMTLEITLVSMAATREWDIQQAEEANRNEARDLLD
jgi:hypothetical protein